MPDITKITVQLVTAADPGAGTGGFVYAGVAGREFHVDSTRNDFEPGDNYAYIFGDSANVLDAARNDPRLPRLETIDADRFPVYLRFEGNDNDDDWCLDRVRVLRHPPEGFRRRPHTARSRPRPAPAEPLPTEAASASSGTGRLSATAALAGSAGAGRRPGRRAAPRPSPPGAAAAGCGAGSAP
ncbi:hypothetical protein [Streptomyces sp. NPDC002779]|uniref:hypothetical protein n=1 Tax=Streptomyces sp. NPDC002779 TaxID=3364664 RepID=UPI00369006A1